jgi:hypothetical protein
MLRIDAFEQHGKLARIDLYACSAAVSGSHAAKRPLLQPLRQHSVAIAIPKQDADLRRSSIQEDE